MNLLEPKNETTIVITGAASGIKAELARGLARLGFSLAAGNVRHRDHLDELVSRGRPGILGYS
ncbi:hypothetical protein [Mycobacterium uberis]|uniref:hypothetical protein n=1 Tax=Mycobacterium uberis TaxID=2162698 RepID=UPI001FB4DEA8|nr:hypothetical protein [Mycobacterium uberis]